MDPLQKKKKNPRKTQSCENGRSSSCKHCLFLAVTRSSFIPLRPERFMFPCVLSLCLLFFFFYIFMLESQFYYCPSSKEQKVPLEYQHPETL